MKRPAIPPAMLLTALLSAIQPAHAESLLFSGHAWTVKSRGRTPTGPGPNVFTDSSRAVYVDEDGALHLTITKTRNVWRATEVVSKEALGYGTYRFDIAPGAMRIADNAVLGLFTYDNAEDETHREVDIELSHWGDIRRENLQCSVQPADAPDHFSRFALTDASDGWIMEFSWQPNAFDCRITDKATGAEIGSGHITKRVPTPGNARIHMNLWLFRGDPPLDNQAMDVTIRSFVFTPLPASP